MFAAAATVAQMLFDGAIHVARWLATKALIIAIMAIVLPWILREIIIWLFKYSETYGYTIYQLVNSYLSSFLSGSDVVIDLELTSIGGYLALQTGLVDYCSIIFTGWGIYWVVCVLAKVPLLRFQS